MAEYFTLPQIIGYIAAVIMVVSFQGKTQRFVVLVQMLGAACWVVHFGVLAAYNGMLLNVIGVLRCIVFSQRAEKAWARAKVWNPIFILLYAVATALAIFVFNDGVKALLPFTGMVITTFALTQSDPFKLRMISVTSSPLWLIYNLIAGSVSGVLVESLNMVSVFVGVVRIDIPRLRASRKSDGAEVSDRREIENADK
ncbi:MAG: YgjV family protein [Clostridia bacterium]|nr:YgjV family protein [Clostridia bacterium]